MTAHPLPAQRYTYTQYLALERETGGKWEFFDGEVWPWEAMAGVTRPHERISKNLTRYLGNYLEGSTCAEYASDMKLFIGSIRTVRYPDGMVACDEDEEEEPSALRVSSPRVLFEIVSDSSVESDYSVKTVQYTRNLPSLREYVIIEQHRPLVTLHARTGVGASWTSRWFDAATDVIPLASLGLEIPIDQLYRSIQWVEGRGVEVRGGGIPAWPAEPGAEQAEEPATDQPA